MVLFFLPGGRAMMDTPAVRRSSPIILRVASPPPNRVGKKVWTLPLTASKVFFEPRFGFIVDLGDGFFQKGNGCLHVFALAAVVAVAFARFFEFLQGGEVDGAEGFDLLGKAADAAVQYFRRFLHQRFECVQIGGAFGQVLMVAFGVNQGFLLLQQGGLGGCLKLRQLGLQGLYAGVLLPALLLNLREFFLHGDVFFRPACVRLRSARRA